MMRTDRPTTTTHTSPRRPTRIALIGAGDWSRSYHLPTLKRLAPEIPLTITGIWNRTTEKAVEAARAFHIGRVYESLDEVLEDSSVECFAVVVHSSALLPIVEKLAPRGLPILTEKPPGRSSAETEELSRIVSAPNLVAFNRRYMPLNRRFKTIADAMERPYFAECRFYRHGRTTNAFITSTGIHAVNYMEHLFGPIHRIRTEKRRNPSNDTWIWTVWATFARGLEALMKFFPCSGASVERYEVHANDMSAFLHSPQTYSTDYPGRLVIHRNGQPVETIDGREEDGVLTNAGFADEYRDFFRCVRSGKPTRSTLQCSIESMRIAEAIERGDEQYVPGPS